MSPTLTVVPLRKDIVQAAHVAPGRVFDTTRPLAGAWELDGAPADVAHVRTRVCVLVLNGGRLDMDLAVESFGVPQPDYLREKFTLDGGDPAIRARVCLRHVETGVTLKLDRLPELLARPFAVERLPEAAVLRAPTIAQPTDRAGSKAYPYETTALFDDYVSARTQRGRSKGTLRFYADRRKPLLRLLPRYARDIEHRQMLGYIETRRAEGAGEVINKELNFLKAALTHAFKSELFERDPRQVIPAFDSMAKVGERWFPLDDQWRVVNWIAARSVAGRDHAACVAFAFAVGAEFGAWSPALRADVRKDFMGAHVHGTKRKTRDRFAPAPLPEQQALLRFVLDNAHGEGGALFTAWSVTNVNRDLKLACEALGIEPSSTNDLRRTYSSRLGQSGVRSELIDRAMGHKGKTVNERHYLKLTDDHLLHLMLEDVRKARNELRTDAFGLIAQSVELRTFNPVPSRPGTSQDAALASLAAAIGEAAAAREWGIVRELTAELRALREGGAP